MLMSISQTSSLLSPFFLLLYLPLSLPSPFPFKMLYIAELDISLPCFLLFYCFLLDSYGLLCFCLIMNMILDHIIIFICFMSYILPFFLLHLLLLIISLENIFKKQKVNILKMQILFRFQIIASFHFLVIESGFPSYNYLDS
jgi:hypothetical protein